ncbi:hypothetical protein TVAG_287820 [Trichomonas vaginalis G3]|uniref:Uncharacterized protein n=1 Tax=Trichomonas vaginalis (strain ATCC PRA-98 / G3) TaxID=412133 RepID=A2ER49_TRIV3|nr:protein ubiquitination [Trichomonas vaginalis G3]EAY04868.1 hypothetical protein TVAG_287820 [Trichomonas vaginalis G3]KAI5495308.1 protein ubiquitination [Trichomonas vaginalis G3]|eukprot:XP_001317091.1 hypothetical protein [Trichomonas vaginalis G3]
MVLEYIFIAFFYVVKLIAKFIASAYGITIKPKKAAAKIVKQNIETKTEEQTEKREEIIAEIEKEMNMEIPKLQNTESPKIEENPSAEPEQKEENIAGIEKEMDIEIQELQNTESPKIEENPPTEPEQKEKNAEEISNTEGFAINQWVSDTISTIIDVSRYNKNPTDYDERILEDIHEFIKNDKFFKIPLVVILRSFKNTKELFTVDECIRICSMTIKNYDYNGLQVLAYLKCTETDGKSAHAILKGINTPLTNAIFIHPFEKMEIQEDTTDLERKRRKLQYEVAENGRKYKAITDSVEEMQKNIEILTKYKENAEKWPGVKEKYEKQVELIEEENAELEESICQWKPAAMKEMQKPKDYIEDIFDAIECDDALSVIYNLQTNSKSVNQEKLFDDETWYPLMYACKLGNLPIVKVLITYGADVNKGQWQGNPLSIAQENKFKEIVEYLKDHGAE